MRNGWTDGGLGKRLDTTKRTGSGVSAESLAQRHPGLPQGEIERSALERPPPVVPPRGNFRLAGRKEIERADQLGEVANVDVPARS